MKVLGCLGMIGAFATGCAVTVAVMSLRPLADPIGQVLFESSRTVGGEQLQQQPAQPPRGGVVEDITSALRVLTSTIQLDGGTRTWTHRDGRQIRASILSASVSTVTIKRESDGRVFTIQQGMLSQGDRDFIRHWRLERGK